MLAAAMMASLVGFPVVQSAATGRDSDEGTFERKIALLPIKNAFKE